MAERLIDANELPVFECAGLKFVPKEFIDNAPTVNAVRVVNCKDCIHRPENDGERVVPPTDSFGYRDDTCPFLFENTFYSRIPPDDFYCMNGKEKP